MRCRICGGTARETYGVHFINGKWLLCRANYCAKHGSFISPFQLSQAVNVVPDPTKRDHIRPGLHVLIFLKENQLLQMPTEGFVRNILTKSFVHSRGIKVRLTDGQIGRVQKILK